MYENLKVEWVPGAVPKAYFYGADNQQLSEHVIGDKDMPEVLQLLQENGFVPSKKVISMGDPVSTTNFGTSLYELYRPGRYFNDAKEFAESLVKNGVKGHLLTITSAEENEAIEKLLQESGVDSVWLGAQDKDLEGTWAWVTGPESGEVFWTDGTTKLYANFKGSEPNNVGKEDCASFTATGWNDVNCESIAYSVVVEYSSTSPSVSSETKTDL